VESHSRRVRSTPNNGHRQTSPAGPFRASNGLSRSSKNISGNFLLEEGYGRLDALNRIGNQVFSVDLNIQQNYVPNSAPVHFPRIWNAPWFDWVQYNAAIEQPMVRNAGEALGVSAMLNLTDPGKGLFSSGVQVKALVEMEKLLAGDQPSVEKGFSGLKSPKWPKDILPPIDQALATKGAQLYATRCQGCHLPPVNSKAFFESNAWLPPNEAGERYLHVEPINITHIGTDFELLFATPWHDDIVHEGAVVVEVHTA
jgi:mono/diheme cytochrome c family protein